MHRPDTIIEIHRERGRSSSRRLRVLVAAGHADRLILDRLGEEVATTPSRGCARLPHAPNRH